jgi:hypothetical protein
MPACVGTLPARSSPLASSFWSAEGTFADVLSDVLCGLDVPANARIVLAGDGDPVGSEAEEAALMAASIEPCERLRPKSHLGNLFAASAAVQVGVAALLAHRRHEPVLANCFGHGTEQAAFLLEAP